MTASVAWSGRVAALEPQLVAPGSSGNQSISNLDKSGRIPRNSPLKYPFKHLYHLSFVPRWVKMDDFSIQPSIEMSIFSGGSPSHP